jgi:hypothetical protein
MASTINASVSSGIVQTADSSGQLQLQTSNSTALTIDTSQNTYIQAGVLWQYAPAPTSIAAVTTLSAAQVAASIINTTGTTYTVTLPSGTQLDTYFTGATATNVGFDFYVVNTASGTITVAVGVSGMTSVGTLTVATAVSAYFRLRRTAANTYILYRLS